MSRFSVLTAIKLALFCLLATSCARNRDEVWNDTKSAGRHMKRGVWTLGGKQGDSKQVRCRSEFYQERDSYPSYEEESEFVPLSDSEHERLSLSFSSRNSYGSPGDPSSSIPGIESFRDPSTMQHESSIFRTVHFPYDSSLVKGSQNQKIVSDVADYMRANPNVFIFVEGHCDQRGPEAYNLALGARRANAIRNMLIKEGVNPENIFTISYGKEKPFVLNNNEDGWAQNRRGEFKIYQL